MKPRWELRDDPPADGATNMQIDANLLRDLESGTRGGTIVRFYSWARPTLSLGRNQVSHRAADIDFCRQHGIDIVHRPTGGLAVLHADEITYAVVSNEPDRFAGGSVYGTYKRVSEALAEGYRRLGVEVALAPGASAGSGTPHSNDPCFVSQSRYELAVDGRKIAGSAQRRLRRAFLQHGSMPLSIDRELLAGATRYGSAESLVTEITALGEWLNPVPPREDLVAAFSEGFEKCFDVTLSQRIRSRGGDFPERSGQTV